MASKGKGSLKRKHAAFVKENKDILKYAPWVESFSPSSIEELAVHKKKISDVQIWIQKASTNPKESLVLLLTGPPGVGKTATVTAICNSLSIEMFVWSNTHQEKYQGYNDDILFNMRDKVAFKETQAVTFSRFLLQSAKYSLFTNIKRVILIEEFPNALVKDPALFHNIIRKYAISCHCPAIFIMSDSVRGENVEKKLFPKDMQLSLNICNISFNLIAPTMLMKVLTRINNSSKVQSSYKQLNKFELENIAADSMGDIRNAINSMQFLCMTQVFKKPQPLKSAAPTPNCSSKRDSSLFLFHALGKILYCKRDASLKTETDALPPKLQQFERDPLVSNPEEVYSNTAISAEGFTLFLQENYIPFVEDINTALECCSWLSESDVLSASWSNRDIMNDYMVSVAARGLMYNFTPCSTGRKWRPLHKPQFYESNANHKQQLNALKYSFKGTHLSMRELMIDLVPFLPKLQSKQLNPVQTALSKELGEMNVKRLRRNIVKTLDEKDCFDLETDDKDSSCPMTDGEKEDKALSENADHFSDEEIVIEEYDF